MGRELKNAKKNKIQIKNKIFEYNIMQSPSSYNIK